MNRALMLACGALAAALVANAAAARCVRDIAESGAVLVRCSDGVRGHIASDDGPPPSANASYRASVYPRSGRGGNYSAPLAASSGYTYQSSDPVNRQSDSAASALSRGRNMGATDRRPY